MSEALLDNLTQSEAGRHGGGFAIAPGIVTNNLDLLGQGRVQVKIPSRESFEPWARVSAVGASASRGFVWIPQKDDEVLVAFGGVGRVDSALGVEDRPVEVTQPGA